MFESTTLVGAGISGFIAGANAGHACAALTEEHIHDRKCTHMPEYQQCMQCKGLRENTKEEIQQITCGIIGTGVCMTSTLCSSGAPLIAASNGLFFGSLAGIQAGEAVGPLIDGLMIERDCQHIQSKKNNKPAINNTEVNFIQNSDNSRHRFINAISNEA
ncbi:hypothetical protein [uncultured Endozoicomonas sp.]|uniref:hypothetical protein n=1 Tax=uncultured Endozoicomonas sp. TaxID=432652 RepID=UPI00262C166C|nr:hypothetical protein [uncultured Endozoicomonas sp.]